MMKSIEIYQVKLYAHKHFEFSLMSNIVIIIFNKISHYPNGFIDRLDAKEWCELPHLSESQSIVTDFNRINDLITNEVKRRAGGNNGIVNEELILRIISPSVINLTLVDLPGIVHVR